MRDRHVPRLCHACQSPMARQEDTCWHCGTRWASEEQPPATLRLVPPLAVTDEPRDDRAAERSIAAAAAALVADPPAGDGHPFAAPARAVAVARPRPQR